MLLAIGLRTKMVTSSHNCMQRICNWRSTGFSQVDRGWLSALDTQNWFIASVYPVHSAAVPALKGIVPFYAHCIAHNKLWFITFMHYLCIILQSLS